MLKPSSAIWSSIERQLRCHRPWGMKLDVSKPNQLTPRIMTSFPAASTRSGPLVDHGAAPRPELVGPTPVVVVEEVVASGELVVTGARPGSAPAVAMTATPATTIVIASASPTARRRRSCRELLRGDLVCCESVCCESVCGDLVCGDIVRSLPPASVVVREGTTVRHVKRR